MTERKILNECPFDSTIEANRMVFGYIKNLSAHSDLGETLINAVKPLGDVQIYSPDISNYRYLTASTQQIVFGFAVGMNSIAFRLNEQMKSRALETGGKAFPECGADWVSFLPFRCDWPKVDLNFWALKAYLNIRESVGLA
jgi:hypothetical protein